MNCYLLDLDNGDMGLLYLILFCLCISAICAIVKMVSMKISNPDKW